jgi:hypothetical protein
MSKFFSLAGWHSRYFLYNYAFKIQVATFLNKRTPTFFHFQHEIIIYFMDSIRKTASFVYFHRHEEP